jgi:micrococcal nuclease
MGVAAVALVACLCSSAWTQPLPPVPPLLKGEYFATVVKVSDVDTYVVEKEDGTTTKIRLHFVDGPEKKQDGGFEAALYATRHLLGETVHIHPVSKSWDRTVADVRWVLGRDLHIDVAWMLALQGHTWCDPRFKPTGLLKNAQQEAKDTGRGLWGTNSKPIPPWEWRKLRKGSA